MPIPLIPSVILLSFSAFSSILLISKGDNKTYQMKFLGATLLIFTLFFLTYVLWFEFELILQYPHLLRSFSPIMFLAGPLFYLSIRNIVFGISGFKREDLIHLTPALIHILELIPLYALPASEKLLIAKKVISEEGGLNSYAQGILPGIWVDLARLLLIISYFIYSVYLVFAANPVLLERLKKEKFKNWLYGTLVFFGIIHVFFLGQYIHNIQYFFTGVSFPVIRTLLVAMMLISILGYNIYNFLKWELIMESSGEEINTVKDVAAIDHHTSNSKSQSPINDGGEQAALNENEIREKLGKLLEGDQIFLKQGLLVNDFAKELGISSRYLPELLEKNYGKSFKDLINQYRVGYAKMKIENGYLDRFTLDSLGREAGFNSRTTFFNAFKKELNVSPSDYWKHYQEGPIQAGSSIF